MKYSSVKFCDPQTTIFNGFVNHINKGNDLITFPNSEKVAKNESAQAVEYF